MDRRKLVRISLAISVIANLAFCFALCKRAYFKHVTEPKAKMALAAKMPYHLNKQEYFKLLPNDSCEIIFLGDSETQNFAINEAFNNPYIKNRGINGDETTGVLARLDEVVESRPYKIFLQIGINDLIRGVSTEAVVSNIQQIIRTIEQKSPETQIYLQNILPCSWKVGSTDVPVNDLVVEANRRLLDVAKEERVPYIDLYSSFYSQGGLKLAYDCGDALHLSGQGYVKWREIIAQDVDEPGVNCEHEYLSEIN